MMGEQADKFRNRARECRERAARADAHMRDSLLRLAKGLDDEADKIELEE